MTLTLYRRHRLECESGKPEDSRSTELDERRKDWGRKCQCQIHLPGTLGGVFSRKSSHTADWAGARAIAAAYEQADSWTGQGPKH
ncbi:MAG: hypothetical protein ACRD2X_11890 [Vicinamibacteraceae bacterium]